MPDDWVRSLEEVATRIKTVPPDRAAHYNMVAGRALALFGLRGKLLDIGCGSGWAASWLRDCDYHGVDPCIEPQGKFFRGAGESLDTMFPAESFDSVLCYSVLQHAEVPSRLLWQAERLLKADGRIGILCCCESEDPVFTHHWKCHEALGLIGAFFVLEAALWMPGFYPEDGVHLAVLGGPR